MVSRVGLDGHILHGGCPDVHERSTAFLIELCWYLVSLCDG